MTEDGETATRVALVTGGNAGIGLQTCKGLLEAGFHVVLCARSQAKAEAAIADLAREHPGATAEPLVIDLASLDSVRQAAAAFRETGRSLDVCVLNAGIMAVPWQRTADGFEQQWQVNVLGHFLFCRLLLPAIMASSAGRIVHVASGAHRLHPTEIDYERLAREHDASAGFEQWQAYGRSKLANILFSNELARRLDAAGSRVTSNAVHPGNVRTGLWSKIGRTNESGISVEEGARTPIYLATSREVEGHSGGYYFMCEPVTTVYDEAIHADLDYVGKSGLRTEVSMSTSQGESLWSAASRDVGLDEDL